MSSRLEAATDEVGAKQIMLGFATLLRDLDDGEEDLPDYRADPAAAFRFVYDGWVRRGDYERGKPRHSARQIKAWLDDDQVRSLETKLAGKTRLPLHDAFSLLRLFLSKWTYDKNANHYTPFAPPDDLDDLTRTLVKDLYPDDTKSLLLPERTRTTGSVAQGDTGRTPATPSALEQTRPTGEVMRELFGQSDVLVTTGRARTILGSDPAVAMEGFHKLMVDLHAIDRQDKRQRTLIWVIDYGLRGDKKSARGAIYNVYSLIVQFRAIALIEREDREALYHWLRNNACIIVGSLSHAEIDRVYAGGKLKLPKEQPDLRWFQADRLFLESVPGRWLDAEGSEAYGKSQHDLWAAPTITTHLKLDDWDLDHSEEIDTRKNLRYFFHGEVSLDSKDLGVSGVRCIPLPQPGSRWSDAYRLAIQAALGRLDRSWDKRAGPQKPPEALAQLRAQHFAALRLDEFLHLADALIDQANDPLTPDHR